MEIDRSILQKYCELLIEKNDLRQSWLPENVQTKIYTFAVKQAMSECFREVAKYDGRVVAGHHIELMYLRDTEIPIPALSQLNQTKLKQFVTRLMENELITGLAWLPRNLKKKFITNILLLMLTTLTVFLESTECDVLGHRIAARFAAQEFTGSHPSQQTVSTTASSRICAPSRICAQCVHEAVNAYIAEERSWLPDLSMERSVLTAVVVCVLTVLEDTFVDFKVNLIGAKVAFKLMPNTSGYALSTLPGVKDKGVFDMRGGGMGSQRVLIARQWREISRADYILALKGQKTSLLESVSKVEMLVNKYEKEEKLEKTRRNGSLSVRLLRGLSWGGTGGEEALAPGGGVGMKGKGVVDGEETPTPTKKNKKKGKRTGSSLSAANGKIASAMISMKAMLKRGATWRPSIGSKGEKGV